MDLVSGCPFWPLKNGLLASYPALDADVSCEIAVVGGGISGALAAFHLVEAGLDVVLLDRRDVATGSTAASTSLLQAETDVPLHRLVKRVGERGAVRSQELGIEAIDWIEKFSARLEQKAGFARRDCFYLARTRGDLPELRREFDVRRRLGFDVELLGRQELRAISSLPHHAAILSRGAAEVDVHRLTHGLLSKVQQRGGRVFDRTAVSEYRFSPRGVKLRTLRGPEVRARKVVLATGYEAAVDLRGVPVALHSTYAVVSEPLENFSGWPKRSLLWETARPYYYLRTTTDGRAVIGGGDVPFRDARARDALLASKGRGLARKFREWFPEIPFETGYSWAGTFAETPDGLPYIGAHLAFPNAYFALGYGGNGVTFSAIAAKIIRDLCLGRINPDVDIFGLERKRAKFGSRGK